MEKSNNDDLTNTRYANKAQLRKLKLKQDLNSYIYYENPLLKLYNFEFTEEDNCYDLIQHDFKNLFDEVKEHDLYFQNRQDVIKQIFETLHKNYRSKWHGNNADFHKDNHLIVLSQNNGNGKSSLLKNLPHFIKEFTYQSNKVVKIKFLPSKDFGSSYNKCDIEKYFILQILNSLNSIFGKADLNVDNISMTSLTELSKNLDMYISDSLENSKTAWDEMNEYFKVKVDYVKPNFDLLVFLFDEVGHTPLFNLHDETDPQNLKLIKQYENLNFSKQEISHFLGLYHLRTLIYSFSKYKTIDIILAGKGSFLPLIGKNSFFGSPNCILYPALKPLNTNERYLERIFTFEMIRGNNLSLKKFLVDTIKKTNMDKKNFNSMMNAFFKTLGKYTGGHPRLLSRVIDTISYIEVDDGFSDYFQYNEDPLIMENNFCLLFDSLSEFVLTESNKDTVLSKFNDTIFIQAIYRIIELKGYSAYNEIELLHFFKILSDNQINNTFVDDNSVKSFISWIINRVNSKKKNNKEDDEQKQLSLRNLSLISFDDILLSIGIPYSFDSINESIRIYFPEYLIKYINSLLTFDDTYIINMLTYANNLLTPNGSKLEEIIKQFYFYVLKTKNKTYLKDYLNNDNLDYDEVYFIYVEGCNVSKNYKKEMSDQLKDALKPFKNKKVALIVKSKLFNNISDGFFVIVIDQFFAFCQVKTKVDEDEKLYKFPEENIIKSGPILCEGIAKELGYTLFTYILISNAKLCNELKSTLSEHQAFIINKKFIRDILNKVCPQVDIEEIDLLLYNGSLNLEIGI